MPRIHDIQNSRFFELNIQIPYIWIIYLFSQQFKYRNLCWLSTHILTEIPRTGVLSIQVDLLPVPSITRKISLLAKRGQQIGDLVDVYVPHFKLQSTNNL
ncbi:hypothetical protein OCU04_004437 [Sclerotinia nivalis]|uniref:Uncharacterized protein n=1 Tax=Sclerotinia nivalis TaxID=352851 RepID=A0A9X0AQF2_9HELO|nr:hypothetical protein OCU04_004437 [Sclerotinia nivalis]